MATRAHIGKLNKDGTVTAIYTHNDGYISHHGPILLNHYNTEEGIDKLLALGTLSSLGTEIGTKHDMDDYKNRPKNSCSAYTRDRNEVLDITTFFDEKDFSGEAEEYAYLFKDGHWFVRSYEYPEFTDLRVATTTVRITS